MADGLSNSPLSVGAVVPGGVTPHPLLSFALSYSSEKEASSEMGSVSLRIYIPAM